MKETEKNVCMFVTNEVTHDPRVRKEAATLVNAGYSVAVIGFKIDKAIKDSDLFEPGYIVVRVDVSAISSLINKLTIYLSYRKKTRFRVKLVLALQHIKKLCHCIYLIFGAARFKANVYHAHDLDTLLAAYWARSRNKGKLVYDSHELWTEQRENSSVIFKRFFGLIENFFLKKVDTVITVNNSIAEELEHRYNIPRPHVLRNFSPHKNCSVTGPTTEKVKVLYHGGYSAGRGLEELIMSVVFWDHSTDLFLRGYGPIEDSLRDIALRNDLSDRIHFLPPVSMETLIEEAAFAHIGIMPYKSTCLNNLYSLPNKLFEYMMAGLAVVASDLPEIRRLNDEASFGLLFDPDSPESIAETVNRLARDKALLEHCRMNALRWSRSVGNWETESKKLVAIYRDLIGQQGDVCG